MKLQLWERFRTSLGGAPAADGGDANGTANAAASAAAHHAAATALRRFSAVASSHHDPGGTPEERVALRPVESGVSFQSTDEVVVIDPHGHSRDEWDSPIEFLLSCLSFAVGLGNIWRFPYLCYRNGGGAFLIPYALNIFLTGIPLFFFELSLGQFSSKSPVTVWSVCPLFQGIGYAMLLISVGIGVYYNIIIAWTFYYLGNTIGSLFDDHLPWTTCDHWWNTEYCQELHTTVRNSSFVHDVNATHESAAGEYFTRNMLQISPSIDEPGSLRPELVLCLAIAWSVVFVALLNGVKSFGKAVYFTALFPYVILTILLVRGLTLPGAADGISFYIKPEWSKLWERQVWADAAIQIFFSLGPCWGGLITLASYNKFNNNCFKDAVVIALANCSTSFFAGFVVFSFVGFMAYELDKPVSEVADSGPGLAFVVYPEAVSLLPGSHVWAILFFLMLLSLGFGTQFSIMETVATVVVDSWPKTWPKPSHRKVLLVSCVIMFAIGLSMVTEGGMYVLQLMDNHAGTYCALIIGVVEVLVVSYAYGVDRFLDDIQTMFNWTTNTIGYRLFRLYWKVMWLFLTPMLLFLILFVTFNNYEPMTYGHYVYPDWANATGWAVSFASVACVPIMMVVQMIKAGGDWRSLIRPKPKWGPGRHVDRLAAEESWRAKGFFVCSDNEDDDEDDDDNDEEAMKATMALRNKQEAGIFRCD